MAETLGVELDRAILPSLSYKPEFASKGYFDTESVFKRLGFTEVHALDYSDFEGADIIHDLNSPDVPKDLVQQFDVVIDHGLLNTFFISQMRFMPSFNS
ncbi:hypothetical protein C3Y92_19980 (plasmid) [Solidesulfovibrio carbinolicus]|uniref:Uncharacterized protein n=2 Tax=Solidesulfovibrio carbinolicus TaxID=296842 RepID=A0A4P6HQH3_9BACT|nr:hypothetical protein C3Y92_19980 [Solidesulfovibrio carbinolicus]